MKPKARFIASVIKTAKTETPQLVFQRGSMRTALIAKRNETPRALKSA